MRIRRIISVVLIISLLSCFTAAFAVGAGSAEDPLITKSYVDGTYPDIVLADTIDMLHNSMIVLRLKLSQAGLQDTKSSYTATAMTGGGVSLGTGDNLTLLSGELKVESLSGTLIDLTTGSLLSRGDKLVSKHHYLAAENTRAGLAALTTARINASSGVEMTGKAVKTFTDVSESEWFYGYVSYAVEKKLINGKTENTYEPYSHLTIAEAIKLSACMHQFYHNGSVTLTGSGPEWYKPYVEYASQQGIVTKTYPDYNAKITREEFVSVFYAALPDSEYAVINQIADDIIPDVKIKDAYGPEIYAFYRSGILDGQDEKGTFNPKLNILRSEVAAILTRMFEKNERKNVSIA